MARREPRSGGAAPALGRRMTSPSRTGWTSSNRPPTRRVPPPWPASSPRRRGAAPHRTPPAFGVLMVLAVMRSRGGRAVFNSPHLPPGAVARRAVPARGHPFGDAVGGFGSLWAYDRNSGAVLRVDPETHRVLARVPVRGPWKDVELAASELRVAVDRRRAARRGAAAPRTPRALRIDPRSNRRRGCPSRARPLNGLPWAWSPPHAIWVWARMALSRSPRHDRVQPRSPSPETVAFSASDMEAAAPARPHGALRRTHGPAPVTGAELAITRPAALVL